VWSLLNVFDYEPICISIMFPQVQSP